MRRASHKKNQPCSPGSTANRQGRVVRVKANPSTLPRWHSSHPASVACPSQWFQVIAPKREGLQELGLQRVERVVLVIVVVILPSLVTDLRHISFYCGSFPVNTAQNSSLGSFIWFRLLPGPFESHTNRCLFRVFEHSNSNNASNVELIN